MPVRKIYWLTPVTTVRSILGLLIAATTACREPTPNSPRAFSQDPSPELLGANTRFPEVAENLPAVTLADAPVDAPVRLSSAALESVIAADGGIAIIGLKTPLAARTSVSRTIPAIGKAEMDAARNAIATEGVEIVRTFVNLAAVVGRVPLGKVAALRAHSSVNYIEPNMKYQLAQVQDTSWGVKKIHAPAVWASGYLGYGANITILDSGIDYQHLIAGGDGPARMNLTDCLYTPDLPEGIEECWDEFYHGTHVAGIIAMESNSQGYIGAAYFPTTVASVRVCGIPQYSGSPACPAANVAGGLDWTVSNGRSRQIVNMSLGSTSYSQLIAEAVTRSHNAGNLLIAAAGNVSPGPATSGSQVYPADLTQVMKVTGTLEDDSFATSTWCYKDHSADVQGGSRYGGDVEISAPFLAYSMILSGQYDNDCGTSMATPHVSSVAALVWGRYPSWTRDQVRSRLTATAIDLGATGYDDHFGHGRVDAERAVLLLGASVSGISEFYSGGTYTWTTSITGGTGSNTYQWAYKNKNSSIWNNLGTGASQARTLTGTSLSFTIRVIVTSGSQSVTATKVVNNCNTDPC